MLVPESMPETSGQLLLPDQAVSARLVQFGEIDVEELIRMICHSIKRETNLGVHQMEVILDDGCLILSGHCHTFYAKQLAQQAVMGVIGDGVQVINNIRVV